jgi:hypothetical protein
LKNAGIIVAERLRINSPGQNRASLGDLLLCESGTQRALAAIFISILSIRRLEIGIDGYLKKLVTP